MDNSANKTKTWGGQQYTETRYSVIKWLEKELPSVNGKVLNISSGGWTVPKQLLDFSKVKEYKTFDKQFYGDSENKADYYGDVHNLPKDWSNYWDIIINNQSIECYENPIIAMDEMHRILKPNGILLIDLPFNYTWFGRGSNEGSLKKKNPVNDYWRITYDGCKLLTKKFTQVDIKGFGGTSENDRFGYCIKAIK